MRYRTCLIVLLGWLGGEASSPAQPAPSFRIVSVPGSPAHRQIERLTGDGSEPIRLSSQPLHKPCYSLSRDERRLAYVAADPQTGLIGYYVTNTDGTGQRLLVSLTEPYQELGCPVLSPDGRRLAFVLSQTHAHTDFLKLIDVDGGSSEHRTVAGPGDFGDPHWSEDSRTVYLPQYLRPPDGTITREIQVGAAASPAGSPPSPRPDSP